jgi:hypothetical protein
VGWWVVQQWREVASEYRPGLLGQRVTPITGPVGWLKYLSKHAARGVRHYQRQGTPAGWERTGRLWGKSGGWPEVEPLRLQLTTRQGHQLRRLVKRYAIAQARAAALGYERAGKATKAAAAWDSVSYLRGMLKSSNEVLGACWGGVGVGKPRGRRRACARGRMERGHGVTGFDALAFARLFRSNCTVCGSTSLTWGSVADEVGRLVDAGQDPDQWLNQVAQGIGLPVGPALWGLDAWRCGDCGEVGVFGPVEVGP